MGRRGGELEAFAAFLGGLLVTGLLAGAMAGAGALADIEPGPLLTKAVAAVLTATWVLSTLALYLRLIARGRTRSGTRS
ncbi:hypothetical protein ACIQ9P_19690 [Kitasatospora sp. NPDC094019]|uniref:hypothetical protein n=1 Tax=Kitasatospora sp. NPDC094019 TaxID=3364091 RepID=UPI00381B0A42